MITSYTVYLTGPFPTIVPKQHLRIAAVVIAVIRTYPT